MQQKKTYFILIFSLLLYLFIPLLIRELDDIRDRYNLFHTVSTENLPPELVVSTTLLGALRGIFVDLLWLRAVNLQQKGEYFEIVQLSDLIGMLEPKLPDIWAFNAWNMAYNISVELPTPRERWNWVKQGISYIRDKGLKYNKTSPLLYKELAWIIFHKIGGYTDDFNFYYKKEFALEFYNVFDGLKVKDLLVVPSREELLKIPPISKLKEKIEKEKKEKFFKWLLKQKRLSDNPSFKEFPRNTLKKLKIYRTANLLEKKYKMDIDLMWLLEKKYAPFDWKLPDSHAIYWVTAGMRYLKKTDNAINYNRLIYFCLQNIYRRGIVHLIFDDKGELLSMYMSPNFPFVDVVDRIMLNFKKKYGGKGIDAAYEYFLQEVISMFFSYNRIKDAQRYYKKLQKNYSWKKDYKVSFNNFILNQFKKEIKEASRDDFRNLITGLLFQSYYSLALGELDRSAGLANLAKILYRFYCREYSERLKLPSFKRLKEIAFQQAQKLLPSYLRDRLSKLIKKK